VYQKWRGKSAPNHGGSDLNTAACLNIPSADPNIHGIKTSLLPGNNLPITTLFTKSKSSDKV
jgi:hypothetical protein